MESLPKLYADGMGPTYDYTPEGRLSRRSWARGATDAYDHRGRMVAKTLCAAAPLRLIKTTTYLWDNWNIIRETTTNLSTFQPFNLSTFQLPTSGA